MNRMFERGATFLLTACLAALLNACGSGAVSSSSDPALPFVVSPSSATAYSGVPATFAISGGGARAPYQVTSSNATILPVPTSPITEAQFILTPGVVASQQSVTISVMDQAGKTATSNVIIQPNLINGDITIIGTAPPAFPNCAGVGVVCAGQSATATLTVSQNGAPARGRSVRFEVVQGSFGFPVDVTQLQPFPASTTVTSDESGRATIILRANTGASPQIATIRATDVASGAFRTATFFIKQSTLGGEFVTIPPEWKITGTFVGECPGGTVDYLIFGGTPPYAVRSSAPLIASVSPALTANENPSRFTVSFPENKSCGSGYQVNFTVTDATGLSIQPTLSNTPGTVVRPTPPIITLPPTISLSTDITPLISLACGQSAQILVRIINPGPTAPTITTAVATPKTPTTALTSSASLDGVITVSRGAGIVGNGATLTPPVLNATAIVIVGAGSADPRFITFSTPTTCP